MQAYWKETKELAELIIATMKATQSIISDANAKQEKLHE